MTYIPDQQINTGSFIPTTNVWDVSQLYSVDVGSPEFKELLVRLYQNVNNIALVLNTKYSGFNLLEEFVNGKLYYNLVSSNPLDLRPSFTKVIDIPALGPGVNNFSHGLTIGTTWSFNYIGGAVSNTGTNNYLPLPFASAGGANNIEVRLDATNVIITNNSGLVFTAGRIILEYLKD